MSSYTDFSDTKITGKPFKHIAIPSIFQAEGFLGPKVRIQSPPPLLLNLRRISAVAYDVFPPQGYVEI